MEEIQASSRLNRAEVFLPLRQLSLRVEHYILKMVESQTLFLLNDRVTTKSFAGILD